MDVMLLFSVDKYVLEKFALWRVKGKVISVE